MRINKFVVGLLVLGLAVGIVGMIGLVTPGHGPVPVPFPGNNASDTATDSVSWTIQGFIELTIDQSTFDFGLIKAGVDSVSEDKANTRHVFSNTAWTLSFSVSGTGSDHLGVALSSDEGKGNDDIIVGYSLKDLRTMDPGTYKATVTYTVAAK